MVVNEHQEWDRCGEGSNFLVWWKLEELPVFRVAAASGSEERENRFEKVFLFGYLNFKSVMRLFFFGELFSRKNTI